MILRDKFGRPLTDLRIIVTNRCNYRCIFCHREGVFNKYGEELSRYDWRFLVETAIEIGVKSFKITGGEPFIREDVVDIMKDIVEYSGVVSVVTNASLLDKYIDKFVKVGVNHVNISLLSLKPNIYYELTGGDLNKVLENIDKLVDHNIFVKINYVVLKQNIDEFREILNYAISRGFDVNIIELIPLGLNNSVWRKLHVSLDPVVKYLEETCKSKYIKEFQSRPVYILSDGVEVSVIKGFCNPELCSKCTRLRVTPDGYLKTCLYINGDYVNSRKYILNRDREGLVSAFVEAIEKREPFFKINASKGV